MAMNHLGDLTEIEYRSLMLGTKYRSDMRTNGSTFLPPINIQLPSNVDWRKEGYVTRVKDQGMDNYSQVKRHLLVLLQKKT